MNDGAAGGGGIEMRVATRSDRVLATVGLMVATAMQAADATIVNVALPQLERDFGASVELGAWVIMSYLCATAVVAPMTGWLRRRHGVRTLFVGSVLGFVAASLLCSVAPGAFAVIAFRVLQGAVGGVIHPLGQAILLDLYPPKDHGRMLAIWGATIMLGPVFGPAIGGIITDLASWRWVFAVNLPLGLFAAWGIWRLRTQPAPSRHLPFDGAGILLLVLGIGGLELCLQRGIGLGWLRSPEIQVEAATAVVALGLMIRRARRPGFAILRPEVFKDLNFAAAAFYNFLTSALLFTSVVFVPALSEGPLGLPATLAGLTIVPRGLFMLFAMLAVGQLIGKVHYATLLTTGVALMAVGLGLLSVLRPGLAIEWMVLGSTIQSIGAGMLLPAFSTLGFSTLPPDLRTDATGLYSLLRQLGFASGLALMTALLQFHIGRNEAALIGHAGLGSAAAAQIATATLRAYQQCFRTMMVVTMTMLPGILLFRAARRSRKAEPVA